MKRIHLLLLSIIFSCLGFEKINAQTNSGVITLSPKDTTICPNQNLTLYGAFATQAPGANSDDVFGSQVVNIGFNFVFYGVAYSQCAYSSNGFVNFDLSKVGQTYSAWQYASALANNDLNNVIMFPFQDLLPSPTTNANVTYQTFGQAPNRKFVIEICQMPQFSCTNQLVTTELILYETTNVIEIHIGEQPSCPGWNSGTAIEGIRGVGGTLQNLVPGRDAVGALWTASNDARRWTPNGASTYILDSIPYNPQTLIPGVDSSDLIWYAENNPLPIGTGPHVNVTPDANTHFYIAKVTGQNGCLGNQTYTFQDTVFIHFGTSYDTTNVEICAGSTYSWFGRNLFAAGNYDTLLHSNMGCDSFLRTHLIVNPLPDMAIKGSPNVQICDGSSTTLFLLNPDPNTTYQWSKDGYPVSGETGSSIIVNQAGKYTATGTTNKGCNATSQAFTLIVNPIPVAKILPLSNDIMCAYDTLEISANPGTAYDYRWSPEKPFRIITGADGQKVKGVFIDPKTEVILTVFNQYGCYDSDTTIVLTKPCCEVNIPSAFSPNGDGLNEYFTPLLEPGQILLSFKVFDRYGKEVYNNEDMKHGWNGRYKNSEEAPSGVYMYYIKYTCADGKLYEKKESVTLLR